MSITGVLKWHKPAIIFTLVFGGGLRFINGLLYYSFSMDEIWLGLNIKNLSFFELFNPLEHNQSAPIFFLLLEKFFYESMQSNIALKIPVTLISIVSLILFYKLLKKLTNDKTIVFTSLIIYSISPSIIWMSICVKQYSVDMLVTLMLLLIYSRKKIITPEILLLSSALIYTSNLVIFIVAALSVHSLINNRNRQINYVGTTFFLSLFLFLISGIGFYVMFVYNHPTKAFMNEYWEGYFLPIIPKTELDFKFYLRAIWSIRNLLFLNDSFLLSGVFALSMIRFLLCPKILLGRSILQLLFTFVTIHLLASSLEVYPFYHRFIYYLTPFLVVMVTARNKFLSQRFYRFYIVSIVFSIMMDFITVYPNKPLDMSALHSFIKDHPESTFIYDDEVEKYVDIVSFQEEGCFVGLSHGKSAFESKKANYIISFFDLSGGESKRVLELINSDCFDTKVIDVQQGFILHQVIKSRPL